MFNEEEEEEEEEEFEENEDNYYFRHRFWRMRRQFEQQNNLQTFNNQIPTISAIINLNGVPQQTFSSSSSPSHQFFPQSTNIYPQQFIPPQSPTDSQSIQIQLHNNELTDNNNNNSQYNNEFQRRKRKINKNHQFQNHPIFKSSQNRYPYNPWWSPQHQNPYLNSFNKRMWSENRWKNKIPKRDLINRKIKQKQTNKPFNQQNNGKEIKNSPQQQQYSPQQLNNPKLEQKRKIHYRTNLVLGAVIICMFFTGICVIITLLRI
ncbi:hypothetical protein ACQ4LE_006678 [Meloidogyne hapla]